MTFIPGYRQAKGSRKNNFTFSSADASRLAALRKLDISGYACTFAPCQTGALTLENANLFLREPLGPNEPGKVTAVDGLLKFTDANLDFNVNDQLLPGITAKVVFNTGQLAGQEFEIKNYNNSTKEFMLIPNNYEDAGELPVAGIQAAVATNMS